MKKIIYALLIFFISFYVSALELNSNNAVLYNMNDNTIILDKNKDSITSIASLTKIMTTIVAIENISNYDEKITVTSSMIKGLKEENAQVIGLYVGEKVTYNDLLYATLLYSAADAARALSYSIAGNDTKYVELMNKKAKELNLVNTHFTNTTGLDTIEKQTSTVNEVATLFSYALKNDKFKEILYTTKYITSNKQHTVTSTLRTTASYYGFDISDILGGKTGYTDNAGRCLASIAYDSTNDITYMLVTTNATTENKYNHIKDAVNVYNYYFTNYKYHNLVDTNDLLIKLDTKYGKVPNTSIYSLKDYPLYYDNSFNKEDVVLEYTGLNLLKPSIINNKLKKDYKIGKIDVKYKDKLYESIDVLLQEDINFSILEFCKVNILYILGFTVLIVLVLFIKFKKKK